MSTTTTKTPKTATATDVVDDGVRLIPMSGLRRRMNAERIGYVAATVGLTIGPQVAPGTEATLAACGVAGAAGAWVYRKAGRDDGHGLLRTCHRVLPVITGAGLYAASAATPGAAWWEMLLPATWGALMGWTTPITRSTDAVAVPDPVAADVVDAPRPPTYTEALARMWEAANLAPGTRLIQIRQLAPERPDFDAVIVAEAGKPVPTLSPIALAAVFDFPEGTVTATSVPGSGPGRMALTAAPTLRSAAGAGGLPGLWRAKVSDPGGAAPGMHMVDHRVEENRIAIRVQADDNKLINLPQLPIARALGMTDTDLLMVETNRLGDGIVSIYREHPLIDLREATREDLTMDSLGRIRIGLRHDGRPAYLPLFDPILGAITDLFVGAPGAGKSVSLLTVLAAERISGVVSIVADAQNGMSLPEASGRTYHFGAGKAAVLATLVAASSVAEYRERISSANGWSGFEIGSPWALCNITLDELNLILAEEAADVPREFRNATTGYVGKFQATGRKFGMGLRFAAQGIHLADLGDKDKIRANSKQGTVSLGRTNSSTTQHMATDGVIPRGVSIEPIPMYFGGGGTDIDAAFDGREEARGPITAGMAWYIQGGAVYLMRTWRAIKERKTYPHLIALFESAPMPTLTPEEDEIFRASYAEALPWAEALLLGDTDDTPHAVPGIGTDVPTPSGAPRPAARPATLADRIVQLLAAGPMSTKNVRDELDAKPNSVSNALTALRDEGRVEQLTRGVWQLVTVTTAPAED